MRACLVVHARVLAADDVGGADVAVCRKLDPLLGHRHLHCGRGLLVGGRCSDASFMQLMVQTAAAAPAQRAPDGRMQQRMKRAAPCPSAPPSAQRPAAPVSPMVPRSLHIRWNSADGMLTCAQRGRHSAACRFSIVQRQPGRHARCWRCSAAGAAAAAPEGGAPSSMRAACKLPAASAQQPTPKDSNQPATTCAGILSTAPHLGGVLGVGDAQVLASNVHQLQLKLRHPALAWGGGRWGTAAAMREQTGASQPCKQLP